MLCPLPWSHPTNLLSLETRTEPRIANKGSSPCGVKRGRKEEVGTVRGRGASLGLLPGLRPEQSLVKELGGGGQRGEGGGQSARLH